jgi:hypothetical protein
VRAERPPTTKGAPTSGSDQARSCSEDPIGCRARRPPS